MSGFDPIAIVGRGCVLPGATTPRALFEASLAGRSLLSPTPPDRWRGLNPELLRDSDDPDLRVASVTGGYVDDPILDTAHFTARIADFDKLDRIVPWLAHSAQHALGRSRAAPRTGIIVGNLSCPTMLGSEFVAGVWTGADDVDPRNRFSSGLPVQLIAEAMQMTGPAFALDAACASSLYAIKLACDALQHGDADVMLAGGVNAADDLFLRLAFTALQVLSPSGQSRPFHSGADGLVPAEGAALVALKRLADAERSEDPILGVIVGIGLSNDGRRSGFLAPSVDGQLRAMTAALDQSGLSPADIGYVDCHATGTGLGDTTELQSLLAAYGHTPLMLGALKANLGHTVTASGAASLVNVLSGMQASVIPPVLCDSPSEALRQSPFGLPDAPVRWEAPIKRAAVSSFGFGGNNAHLIVESHAPARHRPAAGVPGPGGDVAICGIGVVTGDGCDVPSFRRRALGPACAPNPLRGVDLDLTRLGFPPDELNAALGHQSAVLAAAAQALNHVVVQPDRTGVLVGMGIDATAARHTLRLQHAGDDNWLSANAEAIPRLTADGAIGAMPNVLANRLHAQRDFRGFGFTVSGEQLSGIAAVRLGVRALQRGELDAVVAAAVDLCCERAHARAADALTDDPAQHGDAAVAFVLKRRSDAEADGDEIIALIDGDCTPTDSAHTGTIARFGRTHAASAAIEIAATAMALRGRARVNARGAQPAPGRTRAAVWLRSGAGQGDGVGVSVSNQPPDPIAAGLLPVSERYAGDTRADLLERLRSRHPGGSGPVRCALVTTGEPELHALRRDVLAQLDRGQRPSGAGVAFAAAPIAGELAFAFTGAAATYRGAGRELLLAWPEIGEVLASRYSGIDDLTRELYGADAAVMHPRTRLAGCSLISQAHAEFSRAVLGIAPSAVLGLSSGETNALLAFGVWRDIDAMLAEIENSGLYDEQLTGSCLAAAAAWGLPADQPAPWECWRVIAPQAQLQAALAGEQRAYLTIVQAPDDCVIGGEPAACRRVIEALDAATAVPLGLDMVIHCRAMDPFAPVWRRLHSRDTHPAPDLRFYTNASNGPYLPTRDAIADAITRQAVEPVDFPKTVLRAWDDGLRIFVEHGPRGLLTAAIPKILGPRPHLAVALDPQQRRGLCALAETVSALWVHGVPIDAGAFDARMGRLREPSATTTTVVERTVTLAAHRPDVVLVPDPDTVCGRRMQPAPPQLAALILGQNETRTATARLDRTAAAERLIASAGAAHAAFIARQAAVHASFLAARGALGAAALRPMPERADPRDAARSALYTRPHLETLADGRISDVFGPIFTRQDGYRRQVRLPRPPLLLLDRVLSIEGEAGSLGTGRIVTETDVDDDAWYMHAGRMAAGVTLEASQGNMMLASWLGADFDNRGERVYRLLGCDLTFIGELPRAGETLRFDIRIDGYARSGDARLFFFQYDCHVGDRLLISMRNGQAGFFSDAELGQSTGVLWDAAADCPRAGARWDPPPCVTRKRSFDRRDLELFAAGRAFACFGGGFEMAAAHVRTPTIPRGRLRLIDEVVTFEPRGGPWGRGYLRARATVPPDAWFYDAHFKNDPCMPGTLVADAAGQALAFAMAAYGFTIDRDGWRFEPVVDDAARFVCRGQVTPDAAHDLTYEVFVEEIIDGATPTIYAALLCHSDTVKILHCRRFGLRLVPDYPIPAGAPGPVRLVGDSGAVRGDHGALLACARGPLSDAFGALYAPVGGARRVPRLPGGLYQFVSRIVSVDGEPGVPKRGAAVVAEFDVPVGAWYLTEAGSAAVPLSALVEVLLQPCGWLTAYLGFAADRSGDVVIRNLDGSDAVLYRVAGVGTLRVTARLERFAEAGGSTLVFFDVDCAQDDQPIMSMKAAFGLFGPAALRAQVGVPVTARTPIEPSSAAPICLSYDSDELAGAPRLSQRRLRLFDRVTFWRDGGEHRLGRLVADADVDPEAWFFKAHFFQDPVQPGSLGLEAIQQAGRAAVRLAGLADGVGEAEFEPVAVAQPFSWKFRGQVLPTSKRTRAEVEILSATTDGDGILVLLDGAFWVDGIRVYEVRGMGVRLKPQIGRAA